jgi:heme/copper-type cytochrome/quinol oxidase subunit 3
VDYWCLLINGIILIVSGVLARSTLYKKIVNSGKETIIILFLGIIMAIPIPINIVKEIPEL